MRCPACGAAAGEQPNFCPACGARLAAPSPGSDLPAEPRSLERRQLTMMFCDLVDSTSLAEGLDPETFGDLIEAYRTACVVPIERYDGVVARYAGDGILVYFGYPAAHEDDPERAVRAGLEMVAAVKALNEHWRPVSGRDLSVRIGINTGIVVVGDLLGHRTREEMAVFGHAANLAARLQDLAPPDRVVVSTATRSLLQGAVSCRHRGELKLKGISDPVGVHEVVAAGEARRWLSLDDDAARALPFVGREAELAAIARAWSAARAGRGRALLVVGEPGIGKSRIIAAARASIGDESCMWLATGTSPYATNTDFFAFTELFRRLFPNDPTGGPAGDEGLRRTLAATGEAAPEMIAGLAAVLRLPTQGADVAERAPAGRLRELALASIVDWLAMRARTTPVVLVLEDLHWADPSTLEALDRLLGRLQDHRILMIMSSRSRPTLQQGDSVEEIRLDRMPAGHARMLLDHTLHGRSLPPATIDTLLTRAGGVPLFIEELPRALLGQEPTAGAGEAPGGETAIPATLRDALMARLDRMGGAKAVAQIGAVLGHRFDVSTMRQVWDGHEAAMRAGIDALVDGSVLMPCEGVSGEQFEFRHALIEEIAYDSLLRRERRRYHARAAEALGSGDHPGERAELLARHHAGAGDAVAAFEAWLAAGRTAVRRSAYKEALGHMASAERELATADRQADPASSPARRLDLLFARAPALTALYGWADPRVAEEYEALLRCAEDCGSHSHAFFAWRGIYNTHLLRGDLRRALQAAERMRTIAAATDEPDLLLSWHRIIGLHDFLAARFEDAVDHMTTGMAASDPEGTRPAVIANSIAAWALWFLGDRDGAQRHSAAALDMAGEADHPFSRAYALCLAASLAQCRGRSDQALGYAETALDLSVSHEFEYWRAWASMVKGWATAASGRPDLGCTILQNGLDQYQATGAAQMRGWGLCLLADARVRAGRCNEAVAAADAALAEMRRSGIVFCIAEAHRLRGTALCRMGASRAGVAAMLRGFRAAERQRAKPLVLLAGKALRGQLDHRPTQALIRRRALRLLSRTARPGPPDPEADAISSSGGPNRLDKRL